MTTVLPFPLAMFSAADMAVLRSARDRMARQTGAPIELNVIQEDPAETGSDGPGDYAEFIANSDAENAQVLLTIQCTREPARRFVRILENGKAGPASNDLQGLIASARLGLETP